MRDGLPIRPTRIECLVPARPRACCAVGRDLGALTRVLGAPSSGSARVMLKCLSVHHDLSARGKAATEGGYATCGGTPQEAAVTGQATERNAPVEVRSGHARYHVLERT